MEHSAFTLNFIPKSCLKLSSSTNLPFFYELTFVVILNSISLFVTLIYADEQTLPLGCVWFENEVERNVMVPF